MTGSNKTGYMPHIHSGSPAGSVADRAAQFANAMHGAINQRRKYTGDPYIVHPAEVAGIVATVTDDLDVIAAAWLHDVVEDAGVSIDTIHKIFGARVAGMVSDLTDISRPEDGNRAARKAVDRDHSAAAGADSQTVKLADLISNSRSIIEHDRAFARVYLREKELLLNVLAKGHPLLRREAENIMRAGMIKLGMLPQSKVSPS